MGVAAVVAVTTLFFLPTQRVVEYRLRAAEFGFDGFEGGPELQAKVGDTVRIWLTNAGGLPHEFVVVRDRDAAIRTMHDVIDRAQADGLTGSALLEAYERGHDVFLGQLIPFPGTHVNVVVGRADMVEFRVRQQGVFWYICLEGEGTLPDGIHADHQMFGRFVVEP